MGIKKLCKRALVFTILEIFIGGVINDNIINSLNFVYNCAKLYSINLIAIVFTFEIGPLLLISPYIFWKKKDYIIYKSC